MTMDMTGLEKNAANFVPLSPLSFLRRAAKVYPRRAAVIYGSRRYDWQTLQARCHALAAALAARGVKKGDVVTYVAANTPELAEAHYAVPLAGAALNAVNTRLDAATLRYIFDHAESKVIMVDGEFAEKVGEAVQGLAHKPLLVDIEDAAGPGAGKRIGELTYDELLAEGEGVSLDNVADGPADEWQPIAINYTSGTTGEPKGVVYHHRGAYLMAMGSAVAWDMRQGGVFLAVVPMFHCNGWCYPWTMALLCGTIVCLRKVDGAAILDAISAHQVEYLGGAPIVLSLIAEAGAGKKLSRAVNLITAAAPPPAAVLQKMEALGFRLIHVYGLTETYGHVTMSAWQDDWDEMDTAARAEQIARQGVGYPMMEDWTVLGEQNRPVAADGKTLGEIGLRGNTVMSGYYKNPQATAAAFQNGWFKSGDVGVLGADHYLKITDRSKDVIISGGENISSIAVENALCKHPAVFLAAVVAKPDEKWGETPCAFIELAPGRGEGEAAPSAQDILAHARENLPGFMCPRHVVFGELPKTATGKIKKYELRQRAAEL